MVFDLTHQLSTVKMKTTEPRQGELERPTITPGQLAALSLYSPAYQGFVLSGWPADLQYPSQAKSLAPELEGVPLSQSYPYAILQAFCVGTMSEGKCVLMRFQPVDWCKHYLDFLNTPAEVLL
jgi:hypothetical protein